MFLNFAFHLKNYTNDCSISLRSYKCVLNESRRYSLILGGCVSSDSITPNYIFREARINF